MKVQEILQKRAGLIDGARKILEKADAEKRDMNLEERKAWDEMLSDAEKLQGDIEARNRQTKADKSLEKSEDALIPDTEVTPGGSHRASKEYRSAFNAYMRRGINDLPMEHRTVLQVDNDLGGGFITASETFINRMIKTIDEVIGLRALATKYPCAYGETLGFPSQDADISEFSWAAGELTTAEEDTGLTFGKRALTPTKLKNKIIKVSRDLANSPKIDIEGYVSGRVSFALEKTLENGYLTGSGANQPLGIFTASDNGIGTARDVSTGNTDTSPTFDGLIEAKYSVRQPYWPGCRWLFHNTALKLLNKLKDGEGQYIWRASVSEGEPDMLLGKPILVSEFAPHTFTTGQYVGMFGDYSYYWCADAVDMRLQVLRELYVATNQLGLEFSNLAFDGMPVLSEAFARVKLG